MSEISDEKPDENDANLPKTRKKKGQVLYQIEDVLDHKIEREAARKAVLYLEVKWLGYEETTWEKFTQFA